jgi:thiol-disulfide isomerase/thioredoxin
MGRLSPLTLTWIPALGLSAAACDASSDGAAQASRSEQVIATGAPTPAPTAPPQTTATAHAEAPRRAKKLCDGDGNARGRALPKLTLAHLEAAGAPRVDGAMPPARGGWTWLNFWAAWCGPCKEEMPRLAGWQDRLAKAGTPVRFVYISLDDDQRQLQDFLDRQPQEGVRSALWLPEGSSRTSVLSALRMKSSPELPEQALVDPSGRVRCFVEGAVDDGDFAEIADLVGH